MCSFFGYRLSRGFSTPGTRPARNPRFKAITKSPHSGRPPDPALRQMAQVSIAGSAYANVSRARRPNDGESTQPRGEPARGAISGRGAGESYAFLLPHKGSELFDGRFSCTANGSSVAETKNPAGTDKSLLDHDVTLAPAPGGAV